MTEHQTARRRVVAALASAAGLVVAMIAGGGAAHADTATPPSCWVSADTGKSLCVDSPGALFSAVATQEGVRLEVPGQPTAKTPSAVAAPLVETVVAILYDGTSKTGATFVISESNSSNCTGWLFGYASLSPYGWNDRASSFLSYTNCVTTLYENNNYTGATYGPAASANSLGVMNNAASSLRVGS